MKPSQHVVFSAGLALGVEAAMHSWPASLGCFLSGVLIDLDHHLDYCLVHKKFPFKYQDLVHFCWDAKVTKLYLFFHAYEYLFVLWLSILILHLGKIWTGVAIGLTAHIVCDQFTNPVRPMFYFLTFRLQNQFTKVKIVSDRYYQECSASDLKRSRT